MCQVGDSLLVSIEVYDGNTPEVLSENPDG